jgi:hypothetical protein
LRHDSVEQPDLRSTFYLTFVKALPSAGDQPMSDREAVLFANEAFYLAFQARDMAAMDDAWAREAPVTCIHPGWSVLAGREPVMNSWRGIFEGGNAPAIECRAPRVF